MEDFTDIEIEEHSDIEKYGINVNNDTTIEESNSANTVVPREEVTSIKLDLNIFTTFGYITSVIILSVIFILYIIYSTGMNKVCKKLNFRYSFLSWIPGINLLMVVNLGINYIFTIVVIILSALSFLTNDLGLIAIFTILNIIINIIAVNKLYSKISNKPFILTIFTVLTLGLLLPIFLVILGSKDESEPELEYKKIE